MKTTQSKLQANEKRIAEIEAELAKRAAAKQATSQDPESWFESCRVDMATGRMSYSSPKGFQLDHDRMYRQIEIFLPYCSTTEQAIKQAIWSQIAAYNGAQQLATFRR